MKGGSGVISGGDKSHDKSIDSLEEEIQRIWAKPSNTYKHIFVN